MIDQQKILLTGITGAVGSWIAAEALSRGHNILALMRDENIEDARERLRKALDIADAGNHCATIDILKGDVCENLSGIAENKTVTDVSMIFHCAASTEFSESTSEQSFQVNVDGTRNILELAAKLRVPLCYISTAYIAGEREGLVKENETDIGQTFNNIYERTKCEAEKRVHCWSMETGLPTFVFRPSIVIGDSARGRIAIFNGMYNLLRFFDTVSPIIGNEEIRIVANLDATKNLIPVDYLAKAVWHIIEAGVADTYHITNPNPLTLGQLRDIYAKLFGINAKLVTEKEFQTGKATRAELLYRKAGSLYAPYMVTEPLFDRSNTDAVLKNTDICVPAINSTYCARMLDYAKSLQWGKSQRQQVQLSDRSISAIEEYFDDFLAKKKHKQLLPDLRRLSATFRIVMKEKTDMYWSLAIEQGVLTKISRNGMVCDCSFIIDSSTFGDITSAQVTPQKAFFKKQVDIEGDTETGLKLVTVLAAFFKKHPYNAEIRNG